MPAASTVAEKPRSGSPTRGHRLRLVSNAESINKRRSNFLKLNGKVNRLTPQLRLSESQKDSHMASTLKTHTSSSVNVLVEPVHEELRDAGAVLFRHHLVAIARQAYILESHESSFYARLIQPLGFAMSVRAVITRLSGNVQDRDGLEIDKLVRRFFLHPAREEVWAICLLLPNGLQFRSFLDRGIIVNEGTGYAPHISRSS